jgi:predicted ribosome-associated RNA-binding protein Tma20
MKYVNEFEGYTKVSPQIKKVNFTENKIEVHLKDGRVLLSDLKLFPSIKKLSLEKRKKYMILDDGLGLDILECDEIYHVRDFIGWPD